MLSFTQLPPALEQGIYPLEKLSLSLPADLPAGEYAIEIGIDSAPYSPIYFCTDAPRHDAFYQVGEISIHN